MKKLTLFLLIISYASFGQNDPLFQKDSVKIDTVLINTYSYKPNIHNKGIRRSVWIVGKNISPIAENEKQLLFNYLKTEIQEKVSAFKIDGFYQNHQDLYFRINDLAALRKQNFQHIELPPTQFLETKSNLKGDNVELSGRIGVGMVRDKISPMLDVMAGVNFWNSQKSYFWTNLKFGWQPYFSFEKNSDSSYQTNRNDFLYLSFGKTYDTRQKESEIAWQKNWRVGAGYLIKQQGHYFEGNTYKLFFQTRTKARINIMPELIFTNNFKQIYPSITIQF